MHNDLVSVQWKASTGVCSTESFDVSSSLEAEGINSVCEFIKSKMQVSFLDFFPSLCKQLANIKRNRWFVF